MTEAPPMVSPQAPTNTKPKRPVRFEVINLAGDIGVPPLSDGYYFWSGRSWIPVPETFNEVSDLISKMIVTEEPKESSFMSLFKRLLKHTTTDYRAMAFADAKKILQASFDDSDMDISWDGNSFSASMANNDEVKIKFRFDLGSKYDQVVFSNQPIMGGVFSLKNFSDADAKYIKTAAKSRLDKIIGDRREKKELLLRHKKEIEESDNERWILTVIIDRQHRKSERKSISINCPPDLYLRQIEERKNACIEGVLCEGDNIVIEKAVRLDNGESLAI